MFKLNNGKKIKLHFCSSIIAQAFCIVPDEFRSLDDGKFPNSIEQLRRETGLDSDVILARLQQIQSNLENTIVRELQDENCCYDCATKQFTEIKNSNTEKVQEILELVQKLLNKSDTPCLIVGSDIDRLSFALFLYDHGCANVRLLQEGLVDENSV